MGEGDLTHCFLDGKSPSCRWWVGSYDSFLPTGRDFLQQGKTFLPQKNPFCISLFPLKCSLSPLKEDLSEESNRIRFNPKFPPMGWTADPWVASEVHMEKVNPHSPVPEPYWHWSPVSYLLSAFCEAWPSCLFLLTCPRCWADKVYLTILLPLMWWVPIQFPT